MPAPRLANTVAFELCEGGACADPAVAGGKVSCAQGDGCRAGGCYCQIFRRPKGVAENAVWNVLPVDHEGKGRHNADKNDYRCFCVKPILQTTVTIDGETYSTRFQLCGMGTCAMGQVIDVAPGPGIDPAVSKPIRCSGDCDAGCKCTMFRLLVKGPGHQTANWELVGKSGKQVVPAEDYLYRCFCIKGA